MVNVPLRRRILGAIAAIAFLCMPSAGAFAGIASPASDTLSRILVGVQADHEIRFLTPSGINAAGATITIDMPNFVFGSVGAGDIGLTYGPVSGFETSTSVSAVPGSGVWGATIASTTITLTSPTDSGPGSVPAGSFIGIRIGTNAPGGVNQLTNPGSPMSAQITIGGSFGDAVVFGVAIVPADTVNVTAVVTPPAPQTGAGGGGGGGGSNPPTISNIQVINLTPNSARITWDTDKSANSSVSYGTTVSYELGTVADGAMVINHQIDLTGLTPATLYHFRVQSTDASFLTATAADQVFTTPGDTTPPAISNVQVTAITETSALVTWTTDEPATSFVTYGLTPSYGLTDSTSGLSTQHAVQLNGLLPLSTYHFFVLSTDGSGNSASSPDDTFQTLGDVTPPANVSSLTATPGDTTVTLDWTNPTDPDFAGTKIQRTTGGYPTGPFDGTTVYSGTAVTALDAGLTNGTTYFYGAYAFDTHGNFASGALANATPNGPIPPPPPVPTSTPPIPPTTPPTTTPPAVPPPTVPPVPTPAPVPPPTVPTPGQPVQAVFPVFYYGNAGAVQLIPDAAGQIHTLSGSSVLASVPVAGLGNIPTTIVLYIGTSQYSLARSADGLTYSGIFTAPPPGTYLSTARVTFQNGSTADSGQTIVLHGSGAIVEEGLAGPTNIGITGATVQLYRDVQGAWTPVGAPFRTGATGAYGYVVQNGRYYVEVTSDGYLKNVTAPFSVSTNIVNDVIGLIKVPVTKPLPEQPVERAVAVVQQASEQVSYSVKIVRATLNAPAVQQANAIAGPAILAMTLSNSATAVNFFNLLAYLQYLFTQPLLLFGRTRKRKWGIVFNSLTKQPVDLAIIRLVHFETKLVIQTRVTDKFGRYWFLAKKGNYLLEVVKPGYVYPSSYLEGKREDVEYADLYHGTKLELQEGEVIAMNIPMDPVVAEETPARVLARKVIRVLRHSLAFSGVLLGMVVLVISPNIVSALLLLAQIGVYLLFRRLALPAKPKSWGITFDAKTRKPLSGAIIRIFDKKFNKLLETQVTDANGKYGFFVRRNVFFLTVEKPGYKKYVSKDIDLSTKDEAVVDQNISLEPTP